MRHTKITQCEVKTYIFVRYGADNLEFFLWDDTAKTVVWGKNIVFNEKVLFMEMLQTSHNEGWMEVNDDAFNAIEDIEAEKAIRQPEMAQGAVAEEVP